MKQRKCTQCNIFLPKGDKGLCKICKQEASPLEPKPKRPPKSLSPKTVR